MSQTPADAKNPPPLIDVLAGAKVLWQRRALVLAVTAALIFAAILYLGATKPIYTAQGVVLVDPRSAYTTDSNSVLSGLGSDSAAIASQVAVIRSREVLGAIFESERITADPEFSGSGLLSGIIGLFGGSGRQATEQEIFDRFISQVDVEREGLTYVLNVSFKSQDPQKAARIVNAIVDRYIGSQVTEKSDANAAVTGLLGSRIGDLQRAVTEAEQAVEAYRVDNRIFDSGTGGTVVQNQIDRLSEQLLTAKDVARQAASKYEQVVAAGRTPKALIDLAGSVSSETAAKLRDEYNQRSTDYASAQAAFGPRHPTLIRLAAEIGRVEALMIRELERITLELKASRDLAESNVEKIEGDIAELRSEANLSNQRAVELRQLERNAEASRQVLEQFLKRSEETNQLQTLQFSDARVLSAAAAPAQATWPKPAVLLGVSAVLGLILGSAIALYLGPLPDAAVRLRGPTLLRRILPLLGTRPSVVAPVSVAPTQVATAATPEVELKAGPVTPAPATSPEPAMPMLATLRTRFRAPASAPLAAEIDAARREVIDHPQSPFALQVATLVGRLLGSLDAAKSPYVLLVSSLSGRFEKDRLGYSVAAALQRVGASIVIVDLDPLVPPRATAGKNGTPLLLQAMSGQLPLRSALAFDPHSGIATIVDDSDTIRTTAQVKRLLALLAPAFSFAVVIGRPASDPQYSAALSATSDQELIAMAKTDAQVTSTASRPWQGAVVIDYGTEEPPPRAAARSPEVRAAISEIRGPSRYAELT